MAKFNLDTPIRELLADEQAKAALKEVAPKIAENPMVSGLPMSLKQIAGFSGGKITPELLQKIEERLAVLE